MNAPYPAFVDRLPFAAVGFPVRPFKWGSSLALPLVSSPSPSAARKAALAALQAVRQEYQKERITRVVFEKEAGAEQYELSAHDDTDNTITETLACEPAVDDAHTFRVKGGYLAAALGALPDKVETVDLLHADQGGGIVLQSDAAPDHIHLVMLLRM